MTLRTLTFDPKLYKLVPLEPNDAAQKAGAEAIRFDTTVLNKLWTGNAVYRAAIAAVPDTLPGVIEHSGDPVGYFPAYELSRLHSGHDAQVRSAKFGPSALDGDIPVFTHPAQPVERQELSEAEIDLCLDRVLRASGSALSHHTTQKSIDDMRDAMHYALAKDRGQA